MIDSDEENFLDAKPAGTRKEGATSSIISPKTQQGGVDFTNLLKLNLMPFDFAEDGEFDVMQLQNKIDMVMTERKQSSFGPKTQFTMDAIRRERKFSMQSPYQ